MVMIKEIIDTQIEDMRKRKEREAQPLEGQDIEMIVQMKDWVEEVEETTHLSDDIEMKIPAITNEGGARGPRVP